MGSSAREIEREIKETRQRLDVHLDELESRATSNAVRYGRIAAVVVGVAAVGAAAVLIWRRTHPPTLKDRMRGLSVDSLRDLVDEMSVQLKERLPSVSVRVNEEQPREPGTLDAIIRKVAPAVLGTASTAVLQRVGQTGDPEGSAASASQPH